MALIIEDGTGVVGATSYVTVAEARAYASARGVTLSAVDATVEVLLIKAMDYLESKRASFKGSKLHYLQWPRSEVVVDGFDVAETTIPTELKNAQCQLAIEYVSTDPMATSTKAAVKSESVGPISVTYAISDGDRPSVDMPKVDALLEPLLRTGFGLSTMRL